MKLPDISTITDRTELFKRRYNGGTYTFYINKTISCVEGKDMVYISCDTPENAFGYPDTILYSRPDIYGFYGCYTLNRFLPKWILRKIEVQFLRLMKKFDINNGLDAYTVGDKRSINA